MLWENVWVPLPIFNATVKRTVNNYNKYTSTAEVKGKRESKRARENEREERMRNCERDGGLNDTKYAQKKPKMRMGEKKQE